MVSKSLRQESFPDLPPEGRSILLNQYEDGMTQFICHTKNQVEMVNRVFTEKGNMPIHYEEWDEGEDRKYILTFTMLDGDSPLLRN